MRLMALPSTFQGKKLMIVNVASKCGLTPQYEELQKLYDEYGDKLAIIGVPCNQFLGQEPGSSDDIASFCQKNYGVTFQMTEKVNVKGSTQHPLYTWLTTKAVNGVETTKVKWNFQKYLIDENGQYIAMIGPKTLPMSDEVMKHL
jgi:glutathione peroxidase